MIRASFLFCRHSFCAGSVAHLLNFRTVNLFAIFPHSFQKKLSVNRVTLSFDILFFKGFPQRALKNLCRFHPSRMSHTWQLNSIGLLSIALNRAFTPRLKCHATTFSILVASRAVKKAVGNVQQNIAGRYLKASSV